MSEPEVWLRGALPDLAPLLQPVAHSLLQCRLDRLLTYARGEQLSSAQQRALVAEKRADERDDIADVLVTEFDEAVERALVQVRGTDPATLLEPREVGRARLPSTVIGLLFHAAEHTQRHVGQLVTTAKIVRGR